MVTYVNVEKQASLSQIRKRRKRKSKKLAQGIYCMMRLVIGPVAGPGLLTHHSLGCLS